MIKYKKLNKIDIYFLSNCDKIDDIIIGNTNIDLFDYDFKNKYNELQKLKEL